jgi:DNA mismatch endonuclease (patch repair protein)
LHRRGFRFRLSDRKLPGKPDIVLPRYWAAIFVHGCFWHRHANCKVANTPKSNTAFWTEKFDRNVQRDQRVAAALAAMGWRVFVAWECEINSSSKLEATADRLAAEIRGWTMDQTAHSLEVKSSQARRASEPPQVGAAALSPEGYRKLLGSGS